MGVKINFGNCLKQFLLARGWTASQLAREINIDTSYVRKWVRGERIPPLKSDYIHKMAVSIGFNINASSGSILSEAFYKVLISINKEINVDKPMVDLIEEALSEAQIYSLSLKAQLKQNEKCSNEKEIQNILERTEIGTNLGMNTIDNSIFIPSINDIPQFIVGRHSVLNAILSILQAAENVEATRVEEIFMTYQSSLNYFDGYHEMYGTWKNILRKVIHKGWKVHYLYRIDRNINRSLNLVMETIEWAVYKDRFWPSFFKKYGLVTPPSEIIVAKGVGALFCFAAESSEYIDRAFFYKQKDAIKSMYDYVLKMYNETAPLIKILPTEREYFEFITLKDRRPGDFFAICYDLYVQTLPLSVWERYIKRSLTDNKQIQEHLDRISERILIFRRDVEIYKVRHIYHMAAIEHLVKTGKYIGNSRYSIPTKEDVVEHIQNIIYLLRTYKNFEIALLTKEQNMNMTCVPWEVKGGHTVAMITLEEKSPENMIYLGITEETIASAFHEYFLELWERITPKYRDKEFIISWLEEQVTYFENKN